MCFLIRKYNTLQKYSNNDKNSYAFYYKKYSVKLSQKVFHNQIMCQEGKGGGIYWNAESTHAEITSSWERLFYSMTPNHIECIWKKLQVTEIYLFMQERKGERASSYHSVVQRLLHWNPLVLKVPGIWRLQKKGFLRSVHKLIQMLIILSWLYWRFKRFIASSCWVTVNDRTIHFKRQRGYGKIYGHFE